MISLEEIRKRLNYQATKAPKGEDGLPPENLPLQSEMPVRTSVERHAMVETVFRLAGRGPGRIGDWIMRRVDAYWSGPGRNWPAELHEYAACRDFLNWQRRNPPTK